MNAAIDLVKVLSTALPLAVEAAEQAIRAAGLKKEEEDAQIELLYADLKDVATRVEARKDRQV